jgi:hypothetical protein
MITLQGYLKTRIYAMGAVKNDSECKKLRDSQIINFPLSSLFKKKKEETNRLRENKIPAN